MTTGKKFDVSGYAMPGFEAVHEAFIENFEQRQELGAACCVFHRGRPVVDLWGGVRDKASGAPWQADTMVLVFSATKGMAGLAMALAHSRGLFDYEAPVAKYWPEFAQAGKEHVTVRQLLSHQAGLYAFDGMGDKRVISDPEVLAAALARQAPAWEPGTRQGYHAITLGYYESELLRRVDVAERTLGQFFQDEIATPLGIDFYIRLPDFIPNERFALLEQSNQLLGLGVMPLSLYLSALSPHSPIRRALEGSLLPLDPERIYARNLEIPAGGGVGTARAMACAYGAFATGGKQLGVSQDTLGLLMAPPTAPANGFRDEVLKVDVRFSLGFTKPDFLNRFGPPESFGHPGMGGAFAYCDPVHQIGYAYVPNRMDRYLVDPRDIALREGLEKALRKMEA